MAINIKHPEYLKFFKNEIKTLNFLATNQTLISNFQNLSMNASEKHLIYHFIDDHKLTNASLDFFADIDLVIQKKNCKIILEALLNPGFSMSVCSFSIIDLDNSTLLRKFHFDYAPNEFKKPLYHLQYCGEASPKFGELNIDVEPLSPWLSSPRLYSKPINLALMIDMVFNEFQTDETVKIIEKKEWRAFILENERFLIKEYYENISRFFIHDHKDVKLFRDYCYGV